MSITFQSATLATPPVGTAVDTGSGAAGSGTQRVILATDQAALPVTDNGGSLTVDGTVAISGTVAATQSGNWSSRTQDGSGNSLTSATRGSERALSVQIVDGSGTQVTSFGGSGGTASNFGSAFPSAGTAIGAKDSAGTNMAALNLDASGFLKVNVAAGGASGGTSSSFGSAVPATGTAVGMSDGTNMVMPRAVANALDVSVGVLGAGVIAQFDDVSVGTVTENQFAPLRMSSRRAAYIEGSLAHDAVSAQNPVTIGAYSSTAAPSNVSTDGDVVRLWSLANGALCVQPTLSSALVPGGNGIGTSGTPRVTIASDSTGNIATIGTSVTPGTAAANLGKAEDAGHTSGDTGVMMLGVRNDSVAALAGTTLDYIPFTTDNTGRLWASAKIDTALPTGTAALGTVTLDDAGTGWSTTSFSSAASTNANFSKASAGRLHGYAVYNSNASPRYFKLYNKASAPTVGTDTPFIRVLIPAGGGANVSFPSPGITMGTGIAYALTTGAADSDSASVAANEILVNIFYS